MLTSFLTKVRTLLSESLNAYVTLHNETSSFTLGHLHIVPTRIALKKKIHFFLSWHQRALSSVGPLCYSQVSCGCVLIGLFGI